MKTPPCFECNDPSTHKHHVVPKSLGGKRIVFLCKKCHAKVHAPVSSVSMSRLVTASAVGRKPYKLTLPMCKELAELKEKGKSVREAAKIVGVSSDTVQRFWSGKGSIVKTYLSLEKLFCPQKKQSITVFISSSTI